MAGHLAGRIEKAYFKGQVTGATKRLVYRAGEVARAGRWVSSR